MADRKRSTRRPTLKVVDTTAAPPLPDVEPAPATDDFQGAAATVFDLPSDEKFPESVRSPASDAPRYAWIWPPIIILSAIVTWWLYWMPK